MEKFFQLGVATFILITIINATVILFSPSIMGTTPLTCNIWDLNGTTHTCKVVDANTMQSPDVNKLVASDLTGIEGGGILAGIAGTLDYLSMGAFGYIARFIGGLKTIIDGMLTYVGAWGMVLHLAFLSLGSEFVVLVGFIDIIVTFLTIIQFITVAWFFAKVVSIIRGGGAT